MDVFKENQQEILGNSGHQNWHRVVVHDFGGDNIEVSVQPYETWSEMPEEEFHAHTERGKGDRARSIEAAAKRARRKVRHLCKLLKARYMVTLTTKEVITDIDKLQSLFQEFVRRIRAVQSFEYVAAFEYQQRGALHLHIAVANRQDYKLLWSIWHRIVGDGQGRVHVTSGYKKASINKIAAYISKYITKSFEDNALLNKRRYWASKGIEHTTKEVHLLRSDWSFAEVLRYVVEICEQKNVIFDVRYAWCNGLKGLFWIAASL